MMKKIKKFKEKFFSELKELYKQKNTNSGDELMSILCHIMNVEIQSLGGVSQHLTTI